MTNLMSRRALCGLAVFVCLSNSVKANTYYLSSSLGSDNYGAQQAQQVATPWKSLERLNAFSAGLRPGDSVLFRRGDVFYGSLFIATSGSTTTPIVYSAYGDGALPVISGLASITQWTNAGGNKWMANLPGRAGIQVLLLDGVPQRMGRYPDWDAPNGGYLTIDQANGNSITDAELSNSPDWTGGEVVIRKTRWVLEGEKIIAHNGRTLSYQSSSGYGAAAGFGYFIQNHPAALNRSGEWSYTASPGQLFIYLDRSPASFNIQASTVETLVNTGNQSNLVFDRLHLRGGNITGISMRNASNIRLSNCTFSDIGGNAIDGTGTNTLTIENSSFNRTANIACNLDNCNGLVLRGNSFRKTGTIAGAGRGNSGSYETILLSGNNALIEGNTIDSTGYIPVSFRGDDIVIRRNTIRDFAMVKDDGGAIYTWNNLPGAAPASNRTVSENIILNGIGTPEGTDHPEWRFAHGIYLDDNTTGVEVNGNTIANCAGNGIYLHNARSNKVIKNTSYSNSVQIALIHDDIAPASPVRDNVVQDNVFFSLQPSQPVAEYKTNGDDLPSFGSFDRNYYSRPADDNAVFTLLKKVNGNYIYRQTDLDGWRAWSGQDAHSGKSVRTILPFVIRQAGSNQFANSNFNANIDGLYVYSASNNMQAAWANGPLDGGNLKLTFSTLTGSSKGTVIINAGAVTAGKKYWLRFTTSGGNESRMLEAYLRKSFSPYTDLTTRQLFRIGATRTDQQYLFTPSESEPNMSIGLDLPESNATAYIDNIRLSEADADFIDPKDSVRFLYNPTASVQSFTLNGRYLDPRATVYSSSISLQPFTTAVLIRDGAEAPQQPPASPCVSAGTLSYERWERVDGNDVAQIPLQLPPSSLGVLTLFESARNAGEYYGARVRGYLCPPVSGNYVFYISGDDATQLWLSSSAQSSAKQKIAWSDAWTDWREWNKFPSQQSAPIYLKAGEKYYVEALHKEGNGGDHLSVAWRLPDGTMEAPIPAPRLSPFEGGGATVSTQTISFAAPGDFTIGQAPLSLQATASSGLPVSFSIVSGNATINGNSFASTVPGTVIIKASQSGNASYSAAPDVQQTVRVIAVPVVQSCTPAGTILQEFWNAGGTSITDIPVQTPPSFRHQITSMESGVNIADNYGTRISGYICAPQTGNYIFYISGDDATELRLSTNADPALKVRIAYSLSWTGWREWGRYPTQKSAAIYLVQGRQYYIEALMKEGGGGDHLSVAWQLPDGSMEAPLPGRHLSPYEAPLLRGQGAAQPQERSKPSAVPALRVQPNPATGITIVSASTPQSAAAVISLYDPEGHLLKQVFRGRLAAGAIQTFQLDVSTFPAGLYLLRMVLPGSTVSTRLAVVK